ncbi:MAG: TauD/TfdA family dioxygenase, partial [Burkholderiales bacterium]
LLASSAAIHNAILASRPELLDVLYDCYYMTSEEATLRVNPHEELRIPVFSYVDGHLSCLFNRGFYERANRFRNDMRPEFDEATKLVETLFQGDDIQLRFILEPGEILLVNNYTALHARTTFKDSPSSKRSLLRLWLTVPNGRPLGEAYRLKAVGYQPGTR